MFNTASALGLGIIPMIPTPICHALSGLIFIVFPYPGRCPGLICNGLSGLKTMFGVALLKMTGKSLLLDPDVQKKLS